MLTIVKAMLSVKADNVEREYRGRQSRIQVFLSRLQEQ